MISTIIVLLIVVVGLLILVFNETSNNDIEEDSYEPFDYNPNPIIKQEILGNWKSVTEEKFGEKYNYKEARLTFEEETYTLSDSGIEETGYYIIDKEKIFFYENKEDIDKTGSFNEGLIGMEGNNLVIIYSRYPKVVVYERD